MTETLAAPATGTRVRATDPLYWEVSEWLDDESSLLDAARTMEWTRLLAKDLVYRLPVRQNRLRDDPEPQFAPGMFHYDENHTTLVMKVMRLATTASPWAENPMSRTRRFVTNVRVHRTAVDDEVEVTSSLLMARSRYTEPHPLVITAERQDLLRREGEGFLLARRTILVDQATLGYPNLAVFF